MSQMEKVNNFRLIREFYVSHFHTDEDNLNKGKTYQDSILHPYDLVLTFYSLSTQLQKFAQIIKRFSEQIKDERNEKDKPL